VEVNAHSPVNSLSQDSAEPCAVQVVLVRRACSEIPLESASPGAQVGDQSFNILRYGFLTQKLIFRKM
jgi:hypothetical protein